MRVADRVNRKRKQSPDLEWSMSRHSGCILLMLNGTTSFSGRSTPEMGACNSLKPTMLHEPVSHGRVSPPRYHFRGGFAVTGLFLQNDERAKLQINGMGARTANRHLRTVRRASWPDVLDPSRMGTRSSLFHGARLGCLLRTFQSD
jgi:hypothetical protein